MTIEHVGDSHYYGYGSRIEFKNENWNTYWAVSQSHDANDNNDWLYGAGATWTDNIWRTSFNSRFQGQETIMDFSFAARINAHGWLFSSGLHADWELNELNTEWASRLQISASTNIHGWRFTPSAGFSWDEGEQFGEEKHFRIDFSRDL